jgi:hypothetical protein
LLEKLPKNPQDIGQLLPWTVDCSLWLRLDGSFGKPGKRGEF